jgi:radical SAM protein with 4Fe4S-binding SPASM domain
MGVKRVQFYTNAINLKKRLPELLNSDLDNLEISVSDLDPESYLKIFRSTKYDDVLEGISELLKELYQSGKTLPVKINFRSNKLLAEIQESKDFKKFIQPWITDYIHFSDTTSFDNWTGLILQDDLVPGMKLAEDTKRTKMKPCSRLVDVQILANGDVRLCGCRMGNTSNDDLVVGNLLKQSLSEIWYSDKVGEIWENFLYQKYPKICLDCSYYEAIDQRPDRHLQFKDE